MEIRPETPQDIFAIRELTEAAFAKMSCGVSGLISMANA